MRVRIDFWKKVFVEISSHEGFIHDSEDLSFIFRKINIKNMGRRQRVRHVKRVKREIVSLLKGIIAKKGLDLEKNEQELYDNIGRPNVEKLSSLRRRVRFQRGMSDRYLKGLERSYYYLESIKKEFNSQGVPEDLAYLPHVESSFNFLAYSKVGAAGMWQFMRSTARLYKLKMNYLIDQRRDPTLSTKAAARLLKTNFKKLGAWPLAITAYNHGARSLLRAIKKLKTNDIGTIVRHYQGRRFGFASKNFYASFMAVVEISKRPEIFFGPQKKLSLDKTSMIRLPKALRIRKISKTVKVSLKKLQFLNPSLRAYVFRRNYRLPRGFKLNIPLREKGLIAELRKKLNTIKKPIVKKIVNLENHIVKRGESLYSISKLHKTNLNKLMALNNLSSYDILFPGQEIKLKKSKSKEKLLEEKAKGVPFKLKTANDIFDLKIGGTPNSDFSIISRLDSWLLYEKGFNFQVDKIKSGLYLFYLELEETLGHYSDWSGIPLENIMAINNATNFKNLKVNQKILLKLSVEQLRAFKAKRKLFHRKRYFSFMEKNEVQGHFDYVVKKGDTLGRISRKLKLPLWIIRRATLRKENLNIGQIVKLPRIRTL
tara:strand:+ start:184 stop:1977 length:1794 start_codon:yes stop_codon:yes gene_type:complete